MKLNVIFPLLLILFVACTNNNQQKKDDPKEAVMIHPKAEPGTTSPEQCVTMVFDLVKGTKLNELAESEKDRIIVTPGDKTEEGYTIQLTVKNEERGDEVTIGWLGLDFAKRKLYDESLDPDHLEPLEAKQELINKAVDCLKKL